MSQQICYTLANGQQLCMPFYVVIPKLSVSFSDPRQFALDRVLVNATRQDIIALAKMQQMMSKLSPELQASIQTQIEQSLSQIPLPEGISVISSR